MEGLGKSPILSVILANLADSISLEGSDELCVDKCLNTCRGINFTVWTLLKFNIVNFPSIKILATTWPPYQHTHEHTCLIEIKLYV